MVVFHNPAGERSVAATPYSLGLNNDQLETARLGLLANGFPDSVAFLDAVEESIALQAPKIGIRRYDKGNASTLASDAMVAEIVENCDALITAYGH